MRDGHAYEGPGGSHLVSQVDFPCCNLLQEAEVAAQRFWGGGLTLCGLYWRAEKGQG